MNKKKVTILIVSLMALSGSVFATDYFWQKPLGPPLVEVTFARSPTSTGESTQESQTQAQALAQTPAQTLATQSPPLCGEQTTLTILLAGIDYRGDNYLYGLADVIRVVRIDFTQHKVVVFVLDRAIWVEIPGIQEHYGITNGLLNQAYFYGVPAMGYYDGPDGGAGLLAQTLKYNFGINVDNYLVVSMAAFTKGIDALGGIDVYLPEPVDGTTMDGQEGLGFFDAGWHHLNGEKALNLARIREKYSSLIRIENQDAIIQGIYEKLSLPETITKIPELIQILQNTVLTDLSPAQINTLYCLVKQMERTDLVFAEIPEEYYVPSMVNSPEMHKYIYNFEIDFDVIRTYVEAFQNGSWP